MVNQNGQCHEKCNEGYENKGGTCECAANFNRLDNFNNMGSICCAQGLVNQMRNGIGNCEERCDSDWKNNNGTCECGLLRPINYNGVCCPEGSVRQGNECQDQCSNNMVATNGICPGKLVLDKLGSTCFVGTSLICFCTKFLEVDIKLWDKVF